MTKFHIIIYHDVSFSCLTLRDFSFRKLLKNETVPACLPDLREDIEEVMLEQAVKVYEDIHKKRYGTEKFHQLHKNLGVVAFRLGDASACTQVNVHGVEARWCGGEMACRRDGVEARWCGGEMAWR